MIRVILTILLTIIILAAGAFVYFNYKTPTKEGSSISTFEECQNAGYPVQESYPPRCVTDDGQVFTQEIGNELEKTDIIQIEAPRPNQEIKSPLRVAGQARGTWYFEATFPIKLVDKSGNIIAQSYAQAQGEWMTEDFVPFEGKLIFTTDEKEGILIVEKSNPSGLPENADQLEVPVKFR